MTRRRRADSILDITLTHEICHSHTEAFGDPMQGAERQVSLAALNGAVVRAVHFDLIGKCLLADF
jgi:hypothetical protein